MVREDTYAEGVAGGVRENHCNRGSTIRPSCRGSGPVENDRW